MDKNKLAVKFEEWRNEEPSEGHGFGIARLPEDDTESVQKLATALSGLGKKVLVADMPADWKKALDGQKALLSQIYGSIVSGNATTVENVCKKIITEKEYSVIIIDHAENLDVYSASWIRYASKRAADCFILVVRDMDKLESYLESKNLRNIFLFSAFPVKILDIVA